MKTKKYVLVTTNTRGVYFGVLKEHNSAEETVILVNARHCFQWTAHKNNKGIWGLAITGPQESSLVGPTLPHELLLHAVSAVTECSEEAVTAWQKATWR